MDPVYFDGAYYLGPDKGGEKAYRLLNEAMKQTGRAALAKWAARGKQYLVMIRPVGKGLVMQQLLYKDEVRPISEVPIEDAEVKDAELKLAVQLVEQIASDEFHPENYEDEVRKRYHEAIQRKVEGQEITAAPEAPSAQIIDLMEALKASLAAKGAAAAPRRRRRGPPRARRPPAPKPRASPALLLWPMPDSLARVSREVVALRALPAPARAGAARWRATKVKRFRDQEYWGRPVPGFGDPRARLLVVGLAPAAHGGNRTGRVFTGDRSGDFLFAALSPRRLRQPARVGRPRRRARAARLLHRAGRALRPAGQQADAGRDRPLPRVPRARVGAARRRAGRPRPRPHRHGRLPGHAPRDGPRRAPAASRSPTAPPTTSAAASGSSAPTTSPSRTPSPAGSPRAPSTRSSRKVKRHLARDDG